ncbi:MAG: hypothetical protein ABW133_24355 [Polyangiaceae bacterium]
MRNIFSFLAASAVGAAIGCGTPEHGSSGGAASPPVPSAIQLAQACPLSPGGGDAGHSTSPPRVFLEIAAVEGRSDGRTPLPGPREFAEWLNDPGHGGRSVGGLLATNEVATRMPFDIESSGGDVNGRPLSRWDLAVTPHVSDAPSAEVRIDLAVEAAHPAGAAGASPPSSPASPARGARTTLVIRDQQPAFIGLDPAISQAPKERPWMLLLTPYVVRSDEELRRLFECRMARASAQR